MIFKEYEFSYRAKLNNRSVNGKVLASNASEAMRKVKDLNELFTSISITVSKSARKHTQTA